MSKAVKAPRLSVSQRLLQAGLSLLLICAVVSLAAAIFFFHANLSTAGFLQLFLVLVVAIRWGFVQASIASVTAFLCLNYLFTAPLFTFVVEDPQNWVALFAFEGAALLASGLSAKVRVHASEAEAQRSRALKLYELGRAVLLIEQRGSPSLRLSRLISEIFLVERVEFWLSADEAGSSTQPVVMSAISSAHQAYLQGHAADDIGAAFSQRPLRLGTSTVGAMTMAGWSVDPLAADAIASLAAITFERARAIERETRAEVERDAERLRTAVLDGLAHGFKTPLTAIQTASSGLLAMNQLNETQTELVSIIDERTTMLSQLTTRLLQAAALETREIRLRRSSLSLADLVEKLRVEQEPDVRDRIRLVFPASLETDQVDGSLLELALQQLVDNAAKYSAVASPVVITLRQSDSETVVVVENETHGGPSIRPEERTRIFERFYRGAHAMHGPAGTGLGLSIVKKIADAHGGRVAVECLERMTRFTLALPRYGKDQHG